MTELFNLAACKALHMSQPSPPKISIGIEIGQPPMNGGLSSIQKSMNIGGEPHRLSYINSDEASLLKQLGGSGQPVNGVPAYWQSEGWGGDAGFSGPSAADAATSGAGIADYTTPEDPGYDTLADWEAIAEEEEKEIAYKKKLAAWQPYGMRFPPKPKDEMQKKPGVWEDTRKPGMMQKAIAHVAGTLAAAFSAPVVGPLSTAVGRGVTELGLSIRGSPDAMTAADKDDPDQMGMRDWDATQFDVPQDYEDFGGEGEPLLKDPLKIKRPCAPGEVGWPECVEEEEEDVLTGMARYLDQLQKREAQDPYKGQEEFYESIWGPDWRAILARRGNT